jgi:hypothetical protein
MDRMDISKRNGLVFTCDGANCAARICRLTEISNTISKCLTIPLRVGLFFTCYNITDRCAEKVKYHYEEKSV